MEGIHVDEILRGLQGHLKKIAFERLGALPMRMGVARRRPMTGLNRRPSTTYMTDGTKTYQWTEPRPREARVIEFYIPLHFRKPIRWIPTEHRGKLLPFRPPEKKTA